MALFSVLTAAATTLAWLVAITAMTTTTTTTPATAQRTPMTCRDWQVRDEAAARAKAASGGYMYFSPWPFGLCNMTNARQCGVCASFRVTKCASRPAFQPDDGVSVLYCGDCACAKRCANDYDSSSTSLFAFPECRNVSMATYNSAADLRQNAIGYDNGGYACGDNVTSCVGRMCPLSTAPCRFPPLSNSIVLPPNGVTCPSIKYDPGTTCAALFSTACRADAASGRVSFGELVNISVVPMLGGDYSCVSCSGGELINTGAARLLFSITGLTSAVFAAVGLLIVPCLLFYSCSRGSDRATYEANLAVRVSRSLLMPLTCQCGASASSLRPDSTFMWFAKVLDTHDLGTLLLLHQNRVAASSVASSVLYGVALSFIWDTSSTERCDFNVAGTGMSKTVAFVLVTVLWYPVVKMMDLALLTTHRSLADESRTKRAGQSVTHSLMLVCFPLFSLSFAIAAGVIYAQQANRDFVSVLTLLGYNLGVGWAIDLVRGVVMLQCCGVVPQCRRGFERLGEDDAGVAGAPPAHHFHRNDGVVATANAGSTRVVVMKQFV